MLSQSRGEPRAGSRTSRLIGIPAGLLLLIWLDSWIGQKLAPDTSNQLAWAIWFMICIPLALWPAFRRMSWTFACSAALFRSLEKSGCNGDLLVAIQGSPSPCESRKGLPPRNTRSGIVAGERLEGCFSARAMSFYLRLLDGALVIGHRQHQAG